MIPKEQLKALRRIEITTSRLANAQLAGNYTSVVRGQGLAFREVRPYQHGDDVRRIDWNVSARMNEPFIKVFVEEREMTIMMVVDGSASTRFGTKKAAKHEVAAFVSALCTFTAVHNNDRVGLIMHTDEVEKIVPPKRGDKHAMRIVREVFEFEPKSHGTNVAVGLQTLVHVARRRDVAFVISDFFDTGFERALSLASAKHDVILVQLNDLRDDELPDVGLATIEDLESGESFVLDTSDPDVRAHWKNVRQQVRAQQTQAFKKLGVDLVSIDTGGDYVKPLRDLFARRARRLSR